VTLTTFLRCTTRTGFRPCYDALGPDMGRLLLASNERSPACVTHAGLENAREPAL
jgi:hypothetical protein